MSRHDAADVRRYYDRHTHAFLILGQGRDTGAIHRAVWADDVTDREAAFHYVDDQVAALARTLLDSPPEDPAFAQEDLTPSRSPLHVVDLGCGVGASLRYLAGRLPMRGTGITLSPTQARLGRQQIEAAGLSKQITIIEGDYCDLPAEVRRADLAYAIESFVHTTSADAFFAQCRTLVRPGGLLVICDDVRGEGEGAEVERDISEFRAGWHVNALLTPAELRATANMHGFVHERTSDLTPYLELHRFRDRLISAMLTIVGALGIDRLRFDDLVGGRALQKCLQHRWVRYEIAVFRRT